MQQLICFQHNLSYSAAEDENGLSRFNKWMQKHPDYKIVTVNVVQNGTRHVYVTVDIPNKEDETNE